MTKLLKSMLIAAGIAGLAAGVVYAREESKQPSSKQSSGAATSGTSGSSSSASSKAAAQVDINSATEKELAALPKIGDAKAKAIVGNRPYRAKDELVNKKILTRNEYDQIKDQIIAKQKAGSDDKAGKGSSADKADTRK